MEISIIAANASGALITGAAASTALKIRRVADGYLLDWADLTFKAAAWGTLATPLLEVDATNLPGEYKKVVVITAWTDGFYQALVHFDDATTVLNFSGEKYIQDGVDYKSPATLAAADVSGNLPADVVNWKGAAAPAMTGDAYALLGTVRGTDNDTLKTLSDQIDLQALETTLTAIKGSGWTTETLKAIKAAVLAASYTTILQGLAVTMSADLLTVNIDGVSTSITLKQGEAKTLLITVLDADGVAVNLSAATLAMGFKVAKADVAYVIEKDNADFDKTLAASGIISVDFTETDTDQNVATYIGELKASWTGGAVINKSADIKLKIKEAVIPAT